MKKELYITLVVLLLFLINSCSKKDNPTEPADNGTPSADVWDSFTYPQFDYVDEDSTGSGTHLVYYIPKPDTLLKSITLTDCKVLYHDPSEVTKLSKVHLVMTTFDGVAYTTGEGNEKTITFSNSYLTQVVNSRDKKGVIAEIKGVIAHELTHVWQKSCEYQNDGWSAVEGVADAVRYLSGNDNISRRHKGGSWTDGYTTTGFFICWLQDNKDKDFLYKLNQFMGKHYYFKWEEATQGLLNGSVQTFWDQYQAAIN